MVKEITKLAYIVTAEDVEKLLSAINNGQRTTSELARRGSNDEGALSINKFYNSKRLSIGLGFIEERGSELYLTRRGEQVLSEDKPFKAYRAGVNAFPQYRKVLEQILERRDIQDEVSSRKAGFLLQGTVSDEYKDDRLRRAAGTMFRILEVAKLGNEGSGDSRMRVFEPDYDEIKKFLGVSDREDGEEVAEEVTLEDLIRTGSEAKLMLDSEIIDLELSTEDLSKEEVFDLIERLRNVGLEVKVE